MISEEEYVFIVKELDDLGAPEKPLWERVEWAGRKIRLLENEIEERLKTNPSPQPVPVEWCSGPLIRESDPGEEPWIFLCSSCGGRTVSFGHLARCNRPVEFGVVL